MIATWKKLNNPTKIISIIALQVTLCCFCLLVVIGLSDSNSAAVATETMNTDRLSTQIYQTVIAEITNTAPTITNTILPTLTIELSTLTPTVINVVATETLTGTDESTQPLPENTSEIPTCVPKQIPQIGVVVDIVDGDTIKVLIDGLTYSLRYIGIDTPENTTTKEFFGQEATNKNTELVYGKTVALYSDVSDKDRYGRLLRYVFVGEKFINLILVQEGFASAFRYPPDTSCSSVFANAESKPKSQKIGIWGAPPTLEYIAPLPTQSASDGAAVCSCSGNIYNCSNFNTQASAQACYNYCKNQGRGDIHRLDGDNDGIACEALP